jgi:hypothetical protein
MRLEENGLITRVLKGSTISWWGRRRWAIEGFFKTVKYNSPDTFSERGWNRWFIVSHFPVEQSWNPHSIVGDLKLSGVLKYQFGLASFGQQKLLGVYRWLILSFISFVLTHWVYLCHFIHKMANLWIIKWLKVHESSPFQAITSGRLRQREINFCIITWRWVPKLNHNKAMSYF